MEKLDINTIKKMSYTDFVGFINQWNVLPGAHSTLSKWEIFSKLNDKSRILEIACTTGFSSRELAYSSNCNGKAFDISEKSIQSAKLNKEQYTKNIKIDYFVDDGYKFKTSEKFTHIILGAALKFFQKPQEILDKCVTLLTEGGYILASPFYIEKPIPKGLIEEFKKTFGMYPTLSSYKEIMKMYRGFEIIFEEKNNLTEETEEEIDHYCKSTIERTCKIKNIKNKKIYGAMYERLLKIKRMSNMFRPYQGYTVLVLRYRSSVYPNRYVELF